MVAKLSCDGGAAVVDADRTNGRSVQFVVREPAIARILSSKVNHIQNVRGEVIVRGASESALNDGAALSRFVDDPHSISTRPPTSTARARPA